MIIYPFPSPTSQTGVVTGAPTLGTYIDRFGFPAYGSPHGGTQVTGSTHRNDISNGQPYGQRQIQCRPP